jgi:endonuclease/exonuclease/phosphatase family metal-dependent hydrolase
MMPPVLRVMTLNIWNLDGPWRDRRTEIVAWIDRLAPDVVLLQEVVEAADGRNQATWLAERCAADWAVAYGGVGETGVGRFGNAVVSRWPIDDVAVLDLPYERRDDDVQRVVVHARTGGLDVFCTHLNWRFDDGHVRERQAVAVAEFVADRSDPTSALPPVLGGDFNADPDAQEIRYLSGLVAVDGRSVYFQDAWRVAQGAAPGWTWDNRNPFAAADREPDRRIDYVFVGWRSEPKGPGRIESARVVCDRALTGTYASDHFGLHAEIATT